MSDQMDEKMLLEEDYNLTILRAYKAEAEAAVSNKMIEDIKELLDGPYGWELTHAALYHQLHNILRPEERVGE